MSMASPTLRSSSSTAPGPSRKSSPTSMRARPSTADTFTGTSNSASRSAALLPVSAAAASPMISGGGAASLSRSGKGILSLSAIVRLSGHFKRDVEARPPDRDVAFDGFGDGGFGGGALALEPAVGPFDAAVAGRDLGFGHDHQPALEAARLRELLQPLLGGGVDRAVDPHDEMRRRDELAKAGVGQLRDLGERLSRDQRRRELAADRERDFHRC